ncbi:MAG: HNH endonuclease [Planctomycetes bacterium]|nr:HNH endonuclease [Planctomycetota bacterium]
MTAQRIKQHRPAIAPARVATTAERSEDKRFYASARWRRVRLIALARDPICVRCGRAASEHVHHKQPRKDRPDLAFDLNNLEGVCQPCHNAEPVR